MQYVQFDPPLECPSHSSCDSECIRHLACSGTLGSSIPRAIIGSNVVSPITAQPTSLTGLTMHVPLPNFCLQAGAIRHQEQRRPSRDRAVAQSCSVSSIQSTALNALLPFIIPPSPIICACIKLLQGDFQPYVRQAIFHSSGEAETASARADVSRKSHTMFFIFCAATHVRLSVWCWELVNTQN